MTTRRSFVLRSIAVAAAPLAAPIHGRAAGRHADHDPVAAELARYPDLVVRVSAQSIDAPAEIPAGRYRAIEENLRDDAPAHVFFLRVPDDVPESELTRETAEGEEDPPWFRESVFVGNPDRAAANGGRAEGIVDLEPGRHLVIAPLFPDLFPGRFDVVASPATPAAEPDAAAATLVAAREPAATVRAEMREMAFDVPDAIPAGRQLWRIANAGAMAHELAVLPVPKGADEAQTTAAILALFDGGDPGAAGPGWGDWDPNEVGGLGVTSPQRVVWIALELEPGTYAAVCFFPGGTGRPHIIDGMVKVFAVA